MSDKPSHLEYLDRALALFDAHDAARRADAEAEEVDELIAAAARQLEAAAELERQRQTRWPTMKAGAVYEARSALLAAAADAVTRAAAMPVSFKGAASARDRLGLPHYTGVDQAIERHPQAVSLPPVVLDVVRRALSRDDLPRLLRDVDEAYEVRVSAKSREKARRSRAKVVADADAEITDDVMRRLGAGADALQPALDAFARWLQNGRAKL